MIKSMIGKEIVPNEGWFDDSFTVLEESENFYIAQYSSNQKPDALPKKEYREWKGEYCLTFPEKCPNL